MDVFKAGLVSGARFSARYELPMVRKTEFKPTEAIQFGKACRPRDYKQWVHFYAHDYKFERVWKDPARYLDMLKRFEGVITPDFSVYRSMPLSMQIWNVYRNRALAYWMQSNGIDIVHNLRWGDERSYDFAFEGLEQGGSVAVSTYGCVRDKLDKYYFKKGLARMVKVVRPDTIVCFSYTPEDIFGEYRAAGIEIVTIDNYYEMAKKKKVVDE